MSQLKRLWEVYRISRVPYLSEDRIQEIGNKRLRKIVEYAYRTVPYYHRVFRELGLRPTDVQCVEDLKKLPKISKVDIQRNPKDFISKEVDISKCSIHRSSGATGAPTNFYYDQEAKVLVDGIKWRWYSVVVKALGRRLFQRGRVAFISREDSALMSQMQRYRTTYPLVARLFNTEAKLFNDSNPIEENLEALREFKPTAIITFGSYLEILARHLVDKSESLPSLKVAVFTGDSLRPAARRFLEDVLKCEVFGVYGAAEAFVIGFECGEHRGYHLNTDVYPLSVEDKDGKPVEEGKRGKIIISNLLNKAMVLLNYHIGDITEWGADCTCGRNLPMIRDVSGRIDDFLVMPNGELASPMLISHTLRPLSEVKQYQVIQNGLNDFAVKIVPDTKADLSALSREITSRFRTLFGSEAEVKIHYVKNIPKPGGKARTVISRVPPPSF